MKAIPGRRVSNLSLRVQHLARRRLEAAAPWVPVILMVVMVGRLLGSKFNRFPDLNAHSDGIKLKIIRLQFKVTQSLNSDT